jgi:shikimate dehydrogenase
MRWYQAIKPAVSGTAQEPISATTRYCAVYGQPIRHSASPAMHNAAMTALGLDWRYLAFEVAPTELGEALHGAKAMRFVGINLTVPHKLLALDLMDELDASARTWGAVNTVGFEVQRREGDWVPIGHAGAPEAGRLRARGYNTDADAITRSLREDLALELAGKRVLLLGAGGAGRTAALRLACEGVGELCLQNRTVAKAEALAEEIRRLHPAVRVQVGYPRGNMDLLLNATSLGLKADDPLPLDTQAFALARAAAVYDMVYRPAETPLLRLSREAGCRTANGLGMLLHQGAQALEIWSGLPAPVAVMRRALTANIYGHV